MGVTPTWTARDGTQAVGILPASISAFLSRWRRASSHLRGAATAGDWASLEAHPSSWERATACCVCKLAGRGCGSGRRPDATRGVRMRASRGLAPGRRRQHMFYFFSTTVEFKTRARCLCRLFVSHLRTKHLDRSVMGTFLETFPARLCALCCPWSDLDEGWSRRLISTRLRL